MSRASATVDQPAGDTVRSDRYEGVVDTIVQWSRRVDSVVIGPSLLAHRRPEPAAPSREPIMLETMLADVRTIAARERRDVHRPRPAREGTPGRLAESQYLAMVRGYGLSGGMAGSDEMVGLLRCCFDQPISVLARWIVGRAVVCFEWRSTTMLPIFQFDIGDMRIRPEVGAVLRELRDTFDDLEVALWFAQPNTWLDGRAPADVLRTDAASVLDTARADRYVARG